SFALPRLRNRHGSRRQLDKGLIAPPVTTRDIAAAMFDETTIATSAVALTMIVGCEAMGPRAGKSATVDFGIVRSAEQVMLNSTAAEGALLGGTLGLMFGGGGSRAGAAIRGATLGGFAGAAAGGDRM